MTTNTDPQTRGQLGRMPFRTRTARRLVRAVRHRAEAARRRVRAIGVEAGMTTAEYAVGTVAAVAFAAVLYKVVRTSAVQTALSSIVTGALSIHL